MKNIILFFAWALITGNVSGQSDTIFTNNEQIICSVKEVTPEAVKFTYPNEDIINSIYKNTVQKIVFKSGRIQNFAENTSFKKVSGPKDFENVSITKVESEVKGLFKLGDVSSKAKGATTMSNQEKVKDRAYRKLKIEAAMLGANIIYLTDARTQGNKAGTQYVAGETAEASFSGVAYTNVLPKYNDFIKILGDKTNLTAIELVELYSSGSDMDFKEINKPVSINKVYNENGLIMMKASVKGIDREVFRVTTFSPGSFTIVYSDKTSLYNIKILF